MSRSITVQEAVLLSQGIPSTVSSLRPSDLPLPHLCAVTTPASSDANSNAVVVTVQGSGVSIHDLATSHTLHSFSVAQSVAFVCPSVLVPAAADPAPALAPTSVDAMEADLENGDDEATNAEDPVEHIVAEDEVGAQKTEINGLVYAVVHNPMDSGSQKKNDGKRIWVWAVGEAARKLSINGRAIGGGPGKPDWTKSVESSVAHIDAHGTKGLAVFHDTGAISLFKSDLTRPFAAKKGSSSLAKVVWVSPCSLKENEFSLVSERVLVIKNGSTFTAKTVKIESKADPNGSEFSHSISSQERVLQFNESHPVSFCFSAQEKRICTALSNGFIQVLCLKTNNVVGNINASHIHLTSLSGSENVDKIAAIPSPISLQFVGKSYIAVVGLSELKGTHKDILSIWDVRYGTMLFHKVLNAEGEGVVDGVQREPFYGRAYQIQATASHTSGPVLCIATSNLRSKFAKESLSFSTSISVLPYYCPPVSLMASFGKLVGSLTFSLDSSMSAGDLPGMATVAQVPPPPKAVADWVTGLTKLEDLDRAYVIKLVSPKLNADGMTLELLRWIWEKTQLLRTPGTSMKKPEPPTSGESPLSLYLQNYNWTGLPIIEISQPAMVKILGRVLGATEGKGHPLRVLHYLFRTGRVPAKVAVVAKDDQGLEVVKNVSVVDAILARDDLLSLSLLLDTSCMGLDEASVLMVVKYVCALDATGQKLDKRRAALDAFVKTVLGGNKLLPEYKRCLARSNASSSGTKVFDGRRWFFEKVFAVPQQNDFVFARALKLLSVDEVTVVVDWVMQLLELDLRKKSEIARRRAALDKKKSKGVLPWIDALQEADLDASAAQSEIRRQLWWLWDTPGKKNEYSESICQAIDVLNLIMDAHMTTILLTPTLQSLVLRIKTCVDSDVALFSLLERKLRGCLSVFELPAAKAAGDKDKKQEVGQELRQRWKRMVAQVNDGVGSYAVEVMGI
ncbi:hypothetical protein BC830DRAFT_1087672 [Chytriomyces sp. MP71]|nr:hypothetical protein BC830DRAFT_1087672 [Chytriomyces sp. MP71]